ncbi:MAG: PHP domain-containing protein [Treponema sp.]|nr:PHP domain-containing protein [Treponema sp.]
MSYLYETHLHTSFSSACGNTKGSRYVRLYQDMGYSGIIVTDHFFRGNTAVSRSLPWTEWVKQFCRGYEEALNEGIKRGFDVFFGWEETFDSCDDYLVYGLDKEWLLEHPEAKKWTRGEQYQAVKAAGGCVVQAHPFRQHSYIRKVILSSGCVDAVEAANATNYEQSYDALAMRYALKLGLPVTAGSDMHDERYFWSEGVFGIYTGKKFHSIVDYVNAVCNNHINGIKINKGRCDYYGDEKVILPVEVRDANDKSTDIHWHDII